MVIDRPLRDRLVRVRHATVQHLIQRHAAQEGRGPQARPDEAGQLVADLRAAFRWHGDRPDPTYYADPTGWWADAFLLARLAPALAGLFPEARPTLVLGPQSRGALLGALVAVHLGVGLVELRKDPAPASDSDRWRTVRTPPDYRDRNLRLGVRRDLLPAGARVLFVDEWIDTGGQAVGACNLVADAGAQWCGAAVIADGLADAALRRRLDVRALIRTRDL